MKKCGIMRYNPPLQLTRGGVSFDRGEPSGVDFADRECPRQQMDTSTGGVV